MKTHNKRKHTKAKFEEGTDSYPKRCDLCEKLFESEIDMKKHLKTHSYKQIEYRFEECDFLGATPLTMEVHLGKSHSDQFECGLCEYVANNLEALDTHIFTCEIYEWYYEEERFKSLRDLKTHFETEHPTKNTNYKFIHAKQDRENVEEILCKDHFSQDLFPDLIKN